MRKFAPKYFLINGKPTRTPPNSQHCRRQGVLRYVNGGAKHHSMGVLGLRQVFVAKDGSTLPTLNHNVAAETLAPGQTGDAIVTVPAAATTASRFAVYDASLSLRNSNLAGFGGMLTFVAAGAAGVTGPTSPSGVDAVAQSDWKRNVALRFGHDFRPSTRRSTSSTRGANVRRSR